MSESKSQNTTPPLSGGIGLFLFGLLLTYCPVYFQLSGWAAAAFQAAAVLAFAISVGVTFNELSQQWRHRVWSDIGNTLVFLIVVAVLYALTRRGTLPQPWLLAAKILCVVLAALGIIFVSNFLASVPGRLLLPQERPSSPLPPAERAERRTEQVKGAQTLLVAVLSFGGALFGLITLVLHLVTGK